MKKIVKVLLTLGVLAGLMVPASVSAGPTLVRCFLFLPQAAGGVLILTLDVPNQAGNDFSFRNGWICAPPPTP